jgi:hypothetical protein
MPLSKVIQKLELLGPLAPVQVSAALEALPPGRMTFHLRRKVAELERRFRTADPVPPEYACAFPVALANPGQLAVVGGLALAVAMPGRALPAGLTPPSDVYKPAPIAVAQAEASARQKGFALGIAPPACLELDGDSCAAALRVALRAAEKARKVRPEVVISAGVREAAGGMILTGVTCLAVKAQALAHEKPSCKFFFVPAEGEPVPKVAGIELVQLAPGTPLDDLLLVVLAPVPDDLDACRERQQSADELYRWQRYEQARATYEQLWHALESRTSPQTLRWRIEAAVRLAFMALHRADGVAAQMWLERAHQVDPKAAKLRGPVAAELVGAEAESLLDAFCPEEALRALQSARTEWERRLADDSDGDERRLALIAILGTTRSAHLLLGRPDEALAVQARVLELAPEAERPRSLVDEAEALRRLGRLDEAVACLANAERLFSEVQFES